MFLGYATIICFRIAWSSFGFFEPWFLTNFILLLELFKEAHFELHHSCLLFWVVFSLLFQKVVLYIFPLKIIGVFFISSLEVHFGTFGALFILPMYFWDALLVFSHTCDYQRFILSYEKWKWFFSDQLTSNQKYCNEPVIIKWYCILDMPLLTWDILTNAPVNLGHFNHPPVLTWDILTGNIWHQFHVWVVHFSKNIHTIWNSGLQGVKRFN